MEDHPPRALTRLYPSRRMWITERTSCTGSVPAALHSADRDTLKRSASTPMAVRTQLSALSGKASRTSSTVTGITGALLGRTNRTTRTESRQPVLAVHSRCGCGERSIAQRTSDRRPHTELKSGGGGASRSRRSTPSAGSVASWMPPDLSPLIGSDAARTRILSSIGPRSP